MNLSASQILAVLADGRLVNHIELSEKDIIRGVSIDSRTTIQGEIFFALNGNTTNGHEYVRDALEKGATFAVIEYAEYDKFDINENKSILAVESPLNSLQLLATWYRRNFMGDVVAITGSNGKTIVKDALKRILYDQSITASPGSYNGQLGLPLSILSGDENPSVGIFEVGISKPNEMEILEKIVRPTFGIIVNIGMAHIAAFGEQQTIAVEKMKLFDNISDNGWVIGPSREPLLSLSLTHLKCPYYRLGVDKNQLQIVNIERCKGGSCFQLMLREEYSKEIRVSTTSPQIISNLHIAASAALLLGKSLEHIAKAINGYEPLPTRLDLWTSPSGINIINDSHSSDPISVKAALKMSESQSKNSGGKHIFAFAGMREMGNDIHKHYAHIGILAANSKVTHLVTIGNDDFTVTKEAFLNLNPIGIVENIAAPSFLKNYLLKILQYGDTVLYKGPRAGGMTYAAQDLIGSISQRCIWVSLAAIKENVAQIRRHNSGSKVMAMFKALSYGTELNKMAYWVNQLGIDSIGVSCAAEGVSLRRSGVEQDIFVFLADVNDLEDIIQYRLSPILYSRYIIDAFCKHLEGKNVIIKAHLKVDTGMHRLGVGLHEVLKLANKITQSGVIELTGLCTHLAAADDKKHDSFTLKQLDDFDLVKKELIKEGYNDLSFHVSNSAGAIRFPGAHHDIIRLGLSLYGIYTSPDMENEIRLNIAIAVTSKIVDIREIQTAQSIGYSRSFKANSIMKLACVPFGYDDGLPWQLTSDGAQQGYVLISGHRANIIGRVSMDQVLVDITKISNVNIGDEILIYGERNGSVLRLEDVAKKSGTIPHEMLIRLGKRVQRIFIESS